MISKKNAIFHHTIEKLLPWILPAVFFLTWTVLGATEVVPTYLVPSPMEIGKAGVHYVCGTPGDSPYAGRFMDDAGASLIRVGLGFTLAVLFGLPLGILSGRLASVQRFMSTTIHSIRAVPGICWLPLAMVWFGIGIKTTVFLVALAAFFPIYLNAAAGAGQVNPLLLQAGAMLGIKRFRGSFAILLPCAMPHIVTGLRLGLGLSWAYLVLGELTGVPNGLGALIMDARMLGRIDIIVMGVIIIAVVGRLSDLLMCSFLKCCFKSARRVG